MDMPEETSFAAMRFRPASSGDAAAVSALYRSLVGTPFCAWSASYPSAETLADDLAAHALYVLTHHDALIAVGTIRHCREHDELSGWAAQTPCDLMRIGVIRERQGGGVGAFMLRNLLAAARESGYDGMRILVAQSNVPAIKMYRRADAAYRGTAFSYDIAWFCYEIAISR